MSSCRDSRAQPNSRPPTRRARAVSAQGAQREELSSRGSVLPPSRRCIECFDFKAVMSHEVGHALGFNHPNTYPLRNLRANGTMGVATCENPLERVALAPIGDAAAADSIMFSMNMHRDQASAAAAWPPCHRLCMCM